MTRPLSVSMVRRTHIPVDAIAACTDCSIMIQVIHVWRDDELRDVSEAWLTVPLTRGGA